MTKMDEAVEAACAVYDMEGDMALAIQAAVKVLVPDAKDPRRFKEDEYIYRAEGWNNCRAEILKNAGIE